MLGDLNGAIAKRVAIVIAENTNKVERKTLTDWLDELLDIQRGSGTQMEKTRRAIEATLGRKVVWTTVKLIGREIKHLAWDDRKFPTRLLEIGAAVGLLAFGGEAAGIAALGGAIGVPLWFLTAAGAAFAGVLLEELRAPTEKSVRPPFRGRVSHTARRALEVLGLDEAPGSETIRRRYTDLVKHHHPDAKGGDRSHEGKLQEILEAFKDLKKEGLV
jgi:DnaJ-domain-containing protein 1